MDHLAASLKMNLDELKEANMYQQGDISYIVRNNNYTVTVIIIMFALVAAV